MGQDLNKSDQARIEWCITTMQDVVSLGRETPLGDLYSQVLIVVATLKRVLEPNV